MKIIECPRDAMQGMEEFISTEKKVKYINQLLKVGFDTIDVGSFVSAKAIPQMRDTADVLNQLDMSFTKSKLLAIVANMRGAEEAVGYEAITYLGFPLSISETFQKRNTNKSIAEALNTLADIQDLCKHNNKILVTYISMGFGNPYGDPYDVELVGKFADILSTLEVEIVSLADTIGIAKPDEIQYLFGSLTKQFPDIELGAHLHSSPATAVVKINAAIEAGCQRFDGAIKGYGGCPMAEDKLVGNLATETIVSCLNAQKLMVSLDMQAFAESLRLADKTFLH